VDRDGLLRLWSSGGRCPGTAAGGIRPGRNGRGANLTELPPSLRSLPNLRWILGGGNNLGKLPDWAAAVVTD